MLLCYLKFLNGLTLCISLNAIKQDLDKDRERQGWCYESRILQQIEDVGMTHKYISYETLAVIFVVSYLRVVVV
jgi:hypothetical protein